MNDTARRLLAEVARLEAANLAAHQRLRAIQWAASRPVAASPPGGNGTSAPVAATEVPR